MALEKPEVSSENRGPGFVAVRRKIIFTRDEPPPLSFVCVLVSRPCAEAFALQLQILLHNIFVFIEDVASDE